MILSIVIACYNEEKTIAEVLERVNRVSLSELGVQKEIIVVDDGSSDSTWQILQSVKDRYRIKLLRHEKNLGKGSAVRSSLSLVTGDIILIQDADMEYDPEDYPALLLPFVKDHANAVYGSRFLKDAHPKGMQPLFYMGNRFLTFLANFLYGLKITDEATCYKGFRTKILKSMNLECSEFDFCPEVTAKLALKNIQIVEVPVKYFGRTVSAGKKISWKDAYQATRTLLKYWIKSKMGLKI